MNYGTCADPAVAARVAAAADRAGVESLWTAEHAVIPHPTPAGFHLPSDLPWLDSVAAMSMLASATESIGIACGTMELPLHNPVRLAKQLASVDVIANGRLIVALGLGYLDCEFEALGVDKGSRGALMDEYLDVLQEMWTGEPPVISGPTVRIAGIDAHPRPVHSGGLPIILGGGSNRRARRRIVERAHGWYLFGKSLPEVEASLQVMEREARNLDRDPSLGRIEITVTPTEEIDERMRDRYAAVGVDRLVLLPAPGQHSGVGEVAILDLIDRTAALV